jgi:ABC-2 type transport system ATP-binding protein
MAILFRRMTPLALNIRGVRFKYPARRGQPAHEALRGIDLQIEEGQAVAMLGPNGSGKSTLFKVICGLLPRPKAGEIRVFDSSADADIRQSIGVVFQNEGLDRHMTVRENLRDQAILYGIPATAAETYIDEQLRASQLSDRRRTRVKALSKGLARRVDLIRAMLHRPRLLILDEPTVGLDPVARERFLEQLLQERRQHNLTVLLSTHLVDEAERHDRVLLMHEGRIVADGTPVKLRRQAGVRRVMVTDEAWTPPHDQIKQWSRSVSGAGWVMLLEEDGELARRIASQLADVGVPFSIAPPTLADVFEQLTGASLNHADAAAGKPVEAKR